MSILKLNNVNKSYQDVCILSDVNFELESGNIVSIMGPSGSGKSTLLKIIGTLEAADSGSIIIDDIECSKMSEEAKTNLRKRIGFIFQGHCLLPEFTALENITMSIVITGSDWTSSKKKALFLMEKFNIADKANEYPMNMSGGQQQRVSILRAIARNPAIILADEPTGNLDAENANQVFNYMIDAAKSFGIAVIIVTHNLELAKKTDKVFLMLNKQIHPCCV